MGQFNRSEGTIPVFLHQPHNATWHCGKKLCNLCDNDIRDWVAFNGLCQFVGKHINHDQRLWFRIGKLVCHFFRSIERIDVHQNTSRLHNSKRGYRERQPVWDL